MDQSTQKDKSILWLVNHLSSKFGEGSFKITDHWESDLFAIGFSDPTGTYLVYVSTSSVIENGYYVALENPPASDDMPYEPAGEFDNLDLTELEGHFARHLRIV